MFVDILDDNRSKVINFKISVEDCLERKESHVESEQRLHNNFVI